MKLPTRALPPAMLVATSHRDGFGREGTRAQSAVVHQSAGGKKPTCGHSGHRLRLSCRTIYEYTAQLWSRFCFRTCFRGGCGGARRDVRGEWQPTLLTEARIMCVHLVNEVPVVAADLHECGRHARMLA